MHTLIRWSLMWKVNWLKALWYCGTGVHECFTVITLSVGVVARYAHCSLRSDAILFEVYYRWDCWYYSCKKNRVSRDNIYDVWQYKLLSIQNLLYRKINMKRNNNTQPSVNVQAIKGESRVGCKWQCVLLVCNVDSAIKQWQPVPKNVLGRWRNVETVSHALVISF